MAVPTITKPSSKHALVSYSIPNFTQFPLNNTEGQNPNMNKDMKLHRDVIITLHTATMNLIEVHVSTERGQKQSSLKSFETPSQCN